MDASFRKKSVSGTAILSDLDDDFAERAASQMLVSFTRLLERVHVIDHGADLVSIKELIHTVERRARGDGDPTNGRLTEDHGHQVQRRRLAGQETDLSNTAARLRREDRLVYAIATRNIQQQVNALTIGEPQDFCCPFRRFSIVDARYRTKLDDGFQVFITA